MTKLDIHTRLKLARKELMLNQLKIANDLSIQQKTISEIENGKILNIPNTYIYYFYKKGISLEWLYDGKGFMVQKDSEPEKIKTVENLQLNNLFDNVQEPGTRTTKEHNVTDTKNTTENIQLYERLIDSKDLTIKSLLAYVKSQENNLEYVKDLLDRRGDKVGN